MGKLRLSATEHSRAEILAKVVEGDVSLSKAAELIGVSYRQILRINSRYRGEGQAGLVYGLRDRSSNHCIPDAVRGTERFLDLGDEKR